MEHIQSLPNPPVSQINHPPYVDPVITNVLTEKTFPGVIRTDLSDHYPVFCISTLTLKQKGIDKTFYRDMKQLDVEKFQECLAKTFENFLQESFELTAESIDKKFKDFVDLFKKEKDKHAPLKIATRKQRKLMLKPWITEDIYKAILLKQKMYKSHFLHGTEEQKKSTKNLPTI